MKLARDISGGSPVKLMIIVLLVLGLAAGAFTVTRMAKKGKSVKPELSTWKLDEFVVNLADRDEARYLKVSLSLEVQGDMKGSGHGEQGKLPEEAKVRDTIITVLTRKRFTELLTGKGKAQLKSELKAELNSALEGTKVVNIYFTAFAMQ